MLDANTNSKQIGPELFYHFPTKSVIELSVVGCNLCCFSCRLGRERNIPKINGLIICLRSEFCFKQIKRHLYLREDY